MMSDRKNLIKKFFMWVKIDVYISSVEANILYNLKHSKLSDIIYLIRLLYYLYCHYLRVLSKPSILSLVGARTFRCWCQRTKAPRTQRQRRLTYRKSGPNKSHYSAQRSDSLPYQPPKCLPERDICSGRGNWLTFYFKKVSAGKQHG